MPGTVNNARSTLAIAAYNSSLIFSESSISLPISPASTCGISSSSRCLRVSKVSLSPRLSCSNLIGSGLGVALKTSVTSFVLLVATALCPARCLFNTAGSVMLFNYKASYINCETLIRPPYQRFCRLIIDCHVARRRCAIQQHKILQRKEKKGKYGNYKYKN